MSDARPTRSRIALTADQTDLLRVLGLLGIVVALSTVASGGVFLHPENLANVLQQNTVLLILGLAQFLVILTGGIDLSLGAVVALSSVLFVSFIGHGLAVAGLLAVATGAGVGLFNGLLVTAVRLPSFVVTLGVMQIVYSLAKVFTGGGTVQAGQDGAGIPEWVLSFYARKFLGLPLPVFAFGGVLLLALVYLRSAFGHYLYALGSNERAARLAGVPVAGARLGAYALASALGAFGGVLFVALVGYGDPQAGTWLPLDSIAAVSVGGASLKGGRGTAVAVVAGVLIIAVLNNMLNLVGASPNLQPAIKGGIIILAVFAYQRRVS